MEAGARAIAKALEESVQQIVVLAPDRVSQDGAEVFDPFRRAVTQASRGREAPPGQLLNPLASKEMVIKFLVALHSEKKMYRRQVVAVVAVLLHEKLWLQSLLQIPGFPEHLPEDLRIIVEEEQKAQEEALQEEPEEGPEAEEAVGRRSSRCDRSVQQLAAARARLREIGFSASDDDSANDAFTTFNRAVLWVIQSPEQEDDELLSQMDEKDNVLEFLADFHDRKPKHRARITALAVRLLEFDTWREALESSSPSVSATLNALTGRSTKNASSVAVNLETAVELAASRGGVGALYLRMISAKGLSKESAFPFARATLRNTGSAQRTEAAHAEGNGEVLWASSAPFVFEVPHLDAELHVEILSSDVTGDQFLGSATFRVVDAPNGTGPKRISSSLSMGGELCCEVLFRSVSREDSGGAPGGYSGHRTGSVVAGLTAALWDLDSAKVEGGWIISGAKGEQHSGLVCPAGHPIDKRKEGMSWRQSLLHGDLRRCDLCGRSIQRQDTRWRCFHHCDFNVCERCYAEKS
ncbi:unnamed protein product [Durusdinium trenchii]|uniref:C2 domain-containing protein n=2 Tax=Durusdinium trenchii TaxID=1381693 RepID=A0ABP0KIX9_9DINO